MVFVDTSHVYALIDRRDPRHRAAHSIAERTDAEERALDWLLRHDEREYSFVDATSFETMRERGIETALAFDPGFGAAGFRMLRA